MPREQSEQELNRQKEVVHRNSANQPGRVPVEQKVGLFILSYYI